MSGDYSRSRFDPRKHFTSVLMQQGRVQLDSDWNELAEALDRRFRAERSDTLFRAIVPRRTPDAFRVRFAGGAVSLGVGRMYVDGLMPENHGAATGPQVFDPVLYETRGRDPIDYREGQPYFPAGTAPAVPASAAFLVYLDTWQREVTFVEDPDIVEPAIGVDTSTRTQTAWRVRILEGVKTAPSPADFEPLLVRQPADFDPLRHTPPDFWAAATRPPSGRLTTGTDDALGPVDNPCIIPPSGGYRGLENQLYRVEIHRSGAPGTALFKWSRDDASIAAQVTVAQKDALTVASVGRDDVLRFSAGDWVEIVDDLHEPDGARTEAGVLRRVRRVDDEARLLELDPLADGEPGSDLSVTFPAATLTARRTRVRRWDQRDASGVRTVPGDGKPVLLEHGVTITFTVDDADDPRPFRAGDFWTFAARTEGAIIEPLTRAVPRGAHHHFAPLAWVDPNDGQVVDLRTLWPVQVDLPVGECIHVRAESHNHPEGYSIQRAIDDLRDRGGGTVCLGPGVFFISDDALRVESHKNITLRGEGARTVLIRQFLDAAPPPPPAPGPGPGDVLVDLPPVAADPDDDDDGPPPEEYALPDGSDPSGRALLRIVGSANVHVHDLVLVSSAAANALVPGVVAQTVADLRIERCFLVHLGRSGDRRASPAIGLRGALLRATIRDNAIVAEIGVGHHRDADSLLADLTIEHNTFSCRGRGVDLGDGFIVHAGRTRIAGNDLACGDRALCVSGLVPPGALVDIADNTIDAGTDGVVTSAARTRIRGNTIRGPRGRALAAAEAEQDPFYSFGFLAGVGIPRSLAIDTTRIVDNTISGFDIGVLCDAAVGRLEIHDNRIEDVTKGGVIIPEDPALYGIDATIEGNTIRDVGASLREGASIRGIRAYACARLAIRRNLLERVGDVPPDLQGALGEIAGIEVGVSRIVTISDNRLIDVGPQRQPAALPTNCRAIALVNVFETIEVCGNSVTHTDLARVTVGCPALDVSKSDQGTFRTFYADNQIIHAPTQLRSVTVRGNRLESVHSGLGGSLSAVQVVLDGFDMHFTDNFVHVYVPPAYPPPTSGLYAYIGTVAAIPRALPMVATLAIIGNTFTRNSFGDADNDTHVYVNDIGQARAIANHIYGGSFVGVAPALLGFNTSTNFRSGIGIL